MGYKTFEPAEVKVKHFDCPGPSEHATEEVILKKAHVDRGVVPLIKWVNSFADVCTLYSCEGEKVPACRPSGQAYVFFWCRFDATAAIMLARLADFARKQPQDSSESPAQPSIWVELPAFEDKSEEIFHPGTWQEPGLKFCTKHRASKFNTNAYTIRMDQGLVKPFCEFASSPGWKPSGADISLFCGAILGGVEIVSICLGVQPLFKDQRGNMFLASFFVPHLQSQTEDA